ncbi:mercury methylation corrinoid protein HgcA [Candidatus Latescibacterota bacterium]
MNIHIKAETGNTHSDNIWITDSNIRLSDILGTWRVRWGIGRMNYTVRPGLYAANNPDSGSPVLVTANYKLSFDTLRSHLNNRPAWILVLDTNGINVWCAAGKGTFGTIELIKRIIVVGLSDIVTHNTIILPQLGAPGVSAHKVKELTGFRVVYGPVRSHDLNEYIDAGMKATPEMRRVRFGFYDRAVLVPIELVLSLKYLLGIAVFFLLLSGINSAGYSFESILNQGVHAVFLLLLSVINGTVITPLLLPWIPGRAFSVKGIWCGIMIASLYLFSSYGNVNNVLTLISWFLILPSISSFLAMNFTGATTFTSYSGVKKELKYALPVQGIAFALGLILWIAGRFME